MLPRGATSLRFVKHHVPASSASSCGASDVTDATWVSAPPRINTPHCFLPGTAFRRAGMTDSYVRAAELRKGDVLEGVGEAHVCVSTVEKHRPEEHDLIHICTSESKFCVTRDHKILVCGPTGLAVPAAAGDLMAGQALPSVYDGNAYHAVLSVIRERRQTAVVGVCFAEEAAPVLAWAFPKHRPRVVRDAAAVACLGTRHRSADTLQRAGLVVSRTFLDEPRPKYRTRSAGASPDCRSEWSVGTLLHPDRCKVCEIHHRFMLDFGSAYKKLTPCNKGAGCQDCHARHPEFARRHSASSRSSRSAA